MAGYDYRTKPETAGELSFYIFDNLRMQHDGEGGNVYRFDTMKEAAAAFRVIQAEHPHWTIALGGSVDGEREIDFIHRREGWMNVLIDDYKRIPFWTERPDVAQAIQEFSEGPGIDRQLDRNLLGVPVLIPYVSETEQGDSYLANKALLPSNPSNVLTAISECYVEGHGWISLDQLTKMAREHEGGVVDRPVVTRMNVAYETMGMGDAERGRTGYADIAPHELPGMASRFLELRDIRDLEREERLAAESRVNPPVPEGELPDTEKPFFDYATNYGETERVNIEVASYADNDNLYVGMDFYDPDLSGMDFFGDVTVNIIKLQPFMATIDTNNNGEKIMDFLTQNGFGESTGRALPSGFCTYPVFRFNQEKLAEADPRGFEQYCKIAGIEVKKQEKGEASLDELKKQARERRQEKNLSEKEKLTNRSHDLEI